MEKSTAYYDRDCGDAHERALLSAVAGGREEALVELYHRYERPLFVYLQRTLLDRELAEEVLQDVLVALWQRAGSFAGHSRASTWIFGIAHRQALQAARRMRLPRVSTDDCPDVADDDQDAERVTFSLALQEDLEAALALLSPEQREALELTLALGFSYEEAACITDVPVGTVKSRVNQARRLMRKILVHRGWHEEVRS